MNISKMFQYLIKNTTEYNSLLEITNQLPKNEIMAQQILQMIHNDHTKVKLDEDIKNSYYVFIGDTIYLSNRVKTRNHYARLLLISHECVHSLQSKKLQVLNFAFSNIELVAFLMIGIIILFLPHWYWLFAYFAIIVITMIPRIILEIGAIKNSLRLASQYLKEKGKIKEEQQLLKVYRMQLILLSPMYAVSLLASKIVRALLLIVVLFCKRVM